MPKAIQNSPIKKSGKPYIKRSTSEESSGQMTTATIERKPPRTPSKKDKGASWTAEEKWALFEALYPPPKGISWDKVAEVVGRDPQSCRNRFNASLSKKLQAAISQLT